MAESTTGGESPAERVPLRAAQRVVIGRRRDHFPIWMCGSADCRLRTRRRLHRYSRRLRPGWTRVDLSRELRLSQETRDRRDAEGELPRRLSLCKNFNLLDTKPLQYEVQCTESCREIEIWIAGWSSGSGTSSTYVDLTIADSPVELEHFFWLLPYNFPCFQIENTVSLNTWARQVFENLASMQVIKFGRQS